MTLALAMVGLSSIVLAGTPGDNMAIPTGTPLLAPESTGIWSFGLEALYMESNTNFQYAEVSSIITSEGEQEFNNESVTNNWRWGVEADISYLFPGSSRDMSASYTYLNQSGSDSVDSLGNDVIVNGVNDKPHAGFTFLPIGLAAIPAFQTTINSASADVEQTLNAATLTFGQLFMIGNRLSLHPFGGLQFADIDTTNKANYGGDIIRPIFVFIPVDPTLPYTATYKNTSDFEGIGPRAGIDASIHLGNNFSVVGTLAGALLVGNMDSSFEQSYALPIVTPPGLAAIDPITQINNKYKNDSYTAVVPELDAKIGLDYMYAFNPRTSMDIQAGYVVVDYFNAESSDFIDAYTVNSINNTTNFSYNGPYLRLQLNVA